MSQKQPLKLEDLEIYQLAMEIGDLVWNFVDGWDYFKKKTVGDQFIRAADSIAANIAEGYGRYFYKDRRLYSYYSRGSLQETKTWAAKSLKRNLISEDNHKILIEKLRTLHLKLNIYIKKLKTNIEVS